MGSWVMDTVYLALKELYVVLFNFFDTYLIVIDPSCLNPNLKDLITNDRNEISE